MMIMFIINSLYLRPNQEKKDSIPLLSFCLTSYSQTFTSGPSSSLTAPRAEIFVPSIYCCIHSAQRSALYMVVAVGDKHRGNESMSSFLSYCSDSFTSFPLLPTKSLK